MGIAHMVFDLGAAVLLSARAVCPDPTFVSVGHWRSLAVIGQSAVALHV